MARDEFAPDLNEDEPYRIDCPLCGHGVRVAADSGDMCEFCGANLDVFRGETDANQFAESCKERGETAKWHQVENGSVFVVAHKASPHQEVYRRAG
ncbi:MAG TPA: hypothetical protein VHV83_04240 [Armatimonadota bacterium]|nr:hypothetical protein [Armatimonadota bacterium]